MKNKKENQENKTPIIAIIAAFIIVLLFGAVSAWKLSQNAAGNDDKNSANQVVATGTVKDGVQIVKLSMKGYQYILEPSVLQKDIPVRMEVDMSTVTGCLRSVVIPAFNVRKYLTDTDNVIEFTPTKSGTFQITCSMNMGKGSFQVVDNDGSVSAYVEPAPQGGMQCGGGAGGCGCGAKL